MLYYFLWYVVFYDTLQLISFVCVFGAVGSANPNPVPELSNDQRIDRIPVLMEPTDVMDMNVNMAGNTEPFLVNDEAPKDRDARILKLKLKFGKKKGQNGAYNA